MLKPPLVDSGLMRKHTDFSCVHMPIGAGVPTGEQLFLRLPFLPPPPHPKNTLCLLRQSLPPPGSHPLPAGQKGRLASPTG